MTGALILIGMIVGLALTCMCFALALTEIIIRLEKDKQ